MNIYFCGSISGGRQKVDDYARLINELKKYGNVPTDHIGDKSLGLFEENKSPEEIFERDVKFLAEADVVFAELTVPSLGVGYELGHAESLNKKIIGIYDKSVSERISLMIMGNKNIKIVGYNNIEEIINNIESLIK